MNHEPSLVSADMTNEQRAHLRVMLRSAVQLIESSVARYPPEPRTAILQRIAEGATVSITATLEADSVGIDCSLAGVHVFSFHLPKPTSGQMQ